MTEITGTLSNFTPEIAVTVQDGGSPLGYLMIDRLVQGKACGGLRLLPDVTPEEIKLLAHCMTLKFGFVGKPMGGAKAGLIVPRDCPEKERKRRLRVFGGKIAPFLRTGAYFTGTDMGSTAADLAVLHEGAGMVYQNRSGSRSAYFTALTVMMGIEVAAERRKLALLGSTLAVEGFGSVGSAVAELMSRRKGVKVVAVSTACGGLYDPEGLDVEHLSFLRGKSGDRCIFHYGKGRTFSNEELLLLDVDILAPCARQESVNGANADAVKAKVVCGGANYGVSRAAELLLAGRGIISIPHFVASSGGIIGGRLEMAGLGDTFIEDYIRKHYLETIRALAVRAEHKGEPLIFTAEDYALSRSEAMSRKTATGHSRVRNVVCRLMDGGFMPPRFREQAADLYFGRLARGFDTLPASVTSA